MNVALFCHSIISDWNHGNAHFLRGVCTELHARGHDVRCYEPTDAWSLLNLLREDPRRGLGVHLRALAAHYPTLDPKRYDPAKLDLDRELADVELVVVHEWNDPELVRRIGAYRRRHGSFRLLFHDTHHRAITDPGALDRFALEDYDGVLVFGDALRDEYLRRGWGRRVWTWHEAADVRVFRPLGLAPEGDLVWIGNWGDEERTREIHELLLEPVSRLRLRASVHGVRYPADALKSVKRSGAEYRGWLPNYRVPEVLGRFRMTVHIPRGPYLRELRGVPTIRPFEALACGVPLVTARWDDPDGLFRAGVDFLVARDASEMERHLRALRDDPDLRAALSAAGRRTVLARHTCAHRVDELLGILVEMDDLEMLLDQEETVILEPAEES